SGSMNIEGEVLRKGPTKIPVSSGLFVTGAQQSQKPVPLMEDASRHSVVVMGPGGFGVSLTLASQLIVEAGRASFVLNVPSSGTALINLEIPGNHASVHIEPGLITKQTTADDHTVIEATLEPGKQTKVWCTTREV